MSASVLSRCFIVAGTGELPLLPQEILLSPALRSTLRQTTKAARPSLKGPATTSSEPILFPKLQIYCADFPYLHSSIDQRLFTLETWCGYGYGLLRNNNSPPNFQWSSCVQLTARRVDCSAWRTTRSLDNPVPWSWPVKKKRELFQWHMPMSSGSFLRCRSIRMAGSGMLTTFPFGSRYLGKYLCLSAFALALGPTNPRPIAVLAEPFPTSVFKVLIWIFATTTKICTGYRFSQVHTLAFRTWDIHALLRIAGLLFAAMVEYRYSAERHQFSELVHSAGELLHTP